MKESVSPFWDRALHADRRATLLLRGRIKSALRAHFEAQSFIEVECAQLQISPGNEAHVHAFATELVRPGDQRERLYLHTSPEFAAKKLLAAGEKRIFELARVFRNRERGDLHAPEFTMLEWYRAGELYDVVQQDCVSLLRLSSEAVGGRTLRWRGRDCDPLAEPERLSVADAFRYHAGVELLAALKPDGSGDRSVLAQAARRAGLSVAEDD